ncbi:MAG: ATP-binding protein [Deltaproteobacteria bacterium]
MAQPFVKYFGSLRMVIAIIIMMLFFISISAYTFFIDNSNKLNNVAIQNIKENTELQVEELAISLSNKIDAISSNLEIISNSPGVKANFIATISLLESAQNTTKDLTAYYGWINKDGILQWSTIFKNKEFYDRFLGANFSSKEYFEKVKATLNQYFSPVIPSLLNNPTIFIAQPILRTNTDDISNTMNYFQKYNKSANLFNMIVNQQKNIENNAFDGIMYAGIETSSMLTLLENQISPKNRSSLSLIDKDGEIIYSFNPELNGIKINSDKYKQVMANFFDNKNQQILYKSMDNMLARKTESVEIQYISGNSSTIAYTPVHVNDNIVFYLLLDTPHKFATEVDDLLLQQRNYIFGAGALIGIIAFIISIMMVVFNNRLKKIVEEKTKNLKIAVNSLEKANEELKQHDNMQKEFINVAAHELRTPIQTIIGYCEMISIAPKNTNKYLESIRRNAERLSSLTDDILDITRIESNKLKIEKSEFDLKEKINNVIKDLDIKDKNDRKQNIEFISSFNEQIIVFADKIRIYQVISNLLKNALKFTPNGKITVILEKAERNDKKFIVVRIKDDGKGIDPQVLPILFKKFVTKSETGTGLGLYISKNIIEAHGGSIRGYNNLDGKGATFEFTLPLDENKNL